MDRTDDIVGFALGLILCCILLGYSRSSARHVSFISSFVVAGIFYFSRVSVFFDLKMKVFGVMLAILTLCGALVGGVVGILLPKLSVGILLGFSAALMLISVFVSVEGSVSDGDYILHSTIFVACIGAAVYGAQKFHDMCASIRTALVVGFVLALSVDSLTTGHGLRTIVLNVLGTTTTKTKICISACWVPELLLLWMAAAAGYMVYEAHHTGTLAKYFTRTNSRGRHLYSIVPSTDNLPREATAEVSTHRQRTFNYNDALVFNFFDPDNIPEPLLPYAETIFTVAQTLAQQSGFQVDNARNQAEHLLMILYNETQATDDMVSRPAQRLHVDMFANYRKWCKRMGEPSALLKDVSAVKSFEFLLEDILLFLLVWGEAANLKHMPECLCFLLHKCLQENIETKRSRGWNSNATTEQSGASGTATPGSTRYPGFYLDYVITPIYEVVAKALTKSGDHRERKTYDDFNEFFWSPSCLQYALHHVDSNNAMASPAPVSNHAQAAVKAPLLAEALSKSSKTYVEKRSWLHPLLTLNRVFEWHVITFTLLAAWAFSSLLQWTSAFTLQTGSFVFWEITFLGLLWTALEVWTLFPSVNISDPSICGYLLRLLAGLLILSYQSIYYHWSFVSREDTSLDGIGFFHDVRVAQGSNNEYQTFWWWQYVWLSLLSCSLYLLQSVLCWFPAVIDALMTWNSDIVQAFLSVCYPLSQIYVGKTTAVKQLEVFGYIFFWMTLLAFKLWFGYRYVVSPVSVPSLLLYDDYMNYYDGPEALSFVKTALIMFFWWFPHFLVYLIDLSIWYSVWASIVGGFIAIIDRQGAVRESPSFRSHFMRANVAFCQKLMPDDSSLRDENLARNMSTASLTGIDPAGKAEANAARKLSVGTSSKMNNRAKSSADIANFKQHSFANPSSPEHYQQKPSRDVSMLDSLDVRNQRWVVFGRVWNEIIAKLRSGDHISNAERDLFLFTHFDWLSKPVYLPLFETAGCVGMAVVALRESSEEFARELDVKKKMLIVEKFSANMGVAAKEAVSEAWELTCFVLHRLLGNTHLKDIERLVVVLSNWAENNELFYRISADPLEKMVIHVTNIVSTLKSAMAKRKSTPVVTTEYLLQRNEQQKTPIQKSEYTSSIGGGRVKKSVSTGFLSALNDATYAQTLEESTKPVTPRNSSGHGSTKKKQSFKKLEPFRSTLELVDSVRDKVRDEVRNLLSLLRGAIQKGKQANTAEAQDLLDRLTFTLALESGFIWNDVYASTQIDDMSLDTRMPSALNKLQGLLKLRTTQVELKSQEARRRLNFFMNSLYMEMPQAPAMRFAKEYTCITPYYSEDILISKETLQERNSDGVSTLLYLQTLYKDDWANFIERRGIKDEHQVWKGTHLQELRMWAASRAQTLFRTVEGMMQSEAAIRLLAELEECDHAGIELLSKMKFNYVVACQIYGPMKKGLDPKAEDIEFLLARYPNLRVAYVDSRVPGKSKYESDRDDAQGVAGEQTSLRSVTEPTYYSVLIKHDPAGTKARPVSEVYRLKLPGNPIIGEGKPENQNHALVFTRGRYLQAIDMNQDGYFEEALKMRNLLEEFDSGCVILGFREHIFTGSVSSVANYMAMQELSFVTLGQRVLNQPLRVRQHYGHPDLFKKLFVMTEGGMSKASRGINLSEDVFAGFNATIRGHTVNFKEYVQVGKGRDVGLQQTYKFEAKLSQGNAEQSLSRDLSRICGRLDFFRLLSFYYGGIGHYMANTMVMFTLVVVVYTMLTFAVFGEEGVNGRPLHPEGVLQLLLSGMGLLQTMPLLVTLTVEKGVWTALSEIGFMILSGGPLYFIFHIETKSYYFSQTLMAGGAMYRPTGRGFVTRHSPFDENFRFFAASHIYLGFELFVALILFGLYTTSKQYSGLTWALWLTVASFLLGPFWFNPLSFEWNRIKDDYLEWTRWMAERGGTSEQSWEAWWREEVKYVDDLSLSWKVFLALQRGTPWVLIAVGVAGSKFMYSWEEQERVLGVLGVFAAFLLGNWIIHKLERAWPYAVRRFATLFLWTVVAATLVSLFVAHGQYVKYTIALYYVAAAITFMLLLSGVRSQVEIVFKMHDYVVGHCIFCLLGVLALCQLGYFQTWLLYHNALSAGVEIEDILKFARKSKERVGDEPEVVAELRAQVAEQQRLIRQILERDAESSAGSSAASASTSNGRASNGVAFGGDTEMTRLMKKSPEPVRGPSEMLKAISPRAASAVAVPRVRTPSPVAFQTYGATEPCNVPPASARPPSVQQEPISTMHPGFAAPAPALLSNTSSRNASRNGSRSSGLDSLSILTGTGMPMQQPLSGAGADRRSPKMSPMAGAGAAQQQQANMFSFGDTAPSANPGSHSAGFVNLGSTGQAGFMPAPAVRTESGDSFFKFSSPAVLPPRDDGHKNN